MLVKSKKLCYATGGEANAVDYDHMCPRYERASELMGKKWTGLIVRILIGGNRRFRDIRAQVPEMSDRILSERLKELEDEEIIWRRVLDDRPVLIEYGLTEKGRDLAPVVQAIQAWADRWCLLEPEALTTTER